jgi:transcriptional regulator with XRE-family HTH domain
MPEAFRAAQDGDTFPDQLRIRRAISGVTMQQLAKLAGISCLLLWRVENGMQIASPEERERIETALDAAA